MSPRITLTPDLNAKTPAYVRFDKTITQLNRFYWTFNVALERTTYLLETSETLPELSQKNKDKITNNQLLEEKSESERMSRHSFLVLSVTAFEEYLKEILSCFLITNWKEKKTYRIKFIPEELPGQGEIREWLKNRAVDSIVDECLGKQYSDRFEAISKLVFEFGCERPKLDDNMKKLAAMACEARNCIVHASGVADERTVNALRDVFPEIIIGYNIDIKHDLLMKFQGALRDSVRAIDVKLRKSTRRTI